MDEATGININDAGSQPYRFNGKESQEFAGLPYLDYGARFYSPGMSRWTTPDPLAEKYYHISPYAYCANNPLKYIDPQGDSLKLADMSAQEAIGNGLSLGQDIALKFNNGILDSTSIPNNSSDLFLNDLYEIATNEMMVELGISDMYNYQSSDGVMQTIIFENTPIDANTNEFGDGYESLLISQGEPIGSHVQGNLGRTLVPSHSSSMSTNGNIQVIINAKGTLNHRTIGIAHEFGHVVLYMRGLPHKHGNPQADAFIYKRAEFMSKKLGYDF